MPMFGFSDPVLVAILVAIIAFVKYGLPYFMKTKTDTDYREFDTKNSTSFNHFGGVGGPGYMNLKLKEAPVVHVDGKATVWLEKLPHAFTNVNINPLSPECNFKIKLTADTAFGTRVDVYWNIDANGNVQEWDNILVQDWNLYANRLHRTAKTKVLVSQLAEKEFNEEMKGLSSDGAIHSTGIMSELKE